MCVKLLLYTSQNKNNVRHHIAIVQFFLLSTLMWPACNKIQTHPPKRTA